MPRRNNSTKHERYQPVQHGCAGKRAFKSQNEAEKAAEFAMLEHSPIMLSTYQCEHCGKWHLTSVKKTNA